MNILSNLLSISTRSWQIAFLLGSTVLIALTAYLIGSTLFSSAVTVITLIILVINSLTSKGNQSPSSNQISSMFRHLLNISVFLKITASVIWICNAGLVAYSIYLIRVTDITGVVIDATGSPLDKAKITILLDNRTLTEFSSSGRFSFKKIDLNKATDKKLPIEVTWEGLKKNEMIDLNKVDHDKITISIQTQLPVRISYYILSGHALDLFLSQKFEKSWNLDVSSAQLISSNDTHAELKNLASKYSIPFNRTIMQLVPGGYEKKTGYKYNHKGYKSSHKIAGESSGKRFLVSTGGDAYGKYDNLRETIQYELSSKDFDKVRSLITNQSIRKATINEDSDSIFINFWQFIEREGYTHAISESKREIKEGIAHLHQIANKNNHNEYDRTSVNESEKLFEEEYNRIDAIGRLYTYMTKEYFPRDFLVLNTYCEFVPKDSYGCSTPSVEDNGKLSARLIMRMLKLRTLLIENITDKPLSIKDCLVRKNNIFRLRTRKEEDNALITIKENYTSLYPREVLMPKEKIVVPLEIYLTYDGALTQEDFTRMPFANIPSYVFKNDFITFYVTSLPLQLSKMSFATQYGKNEPAIDYHQDFIWGPSTNIAGIQIGDMIYPVRKFDSKNILVVGDFEEYGSCPYAYTYSEEKGEWKVEDHILFGKNNKTKEGGDLIDLKRFDGKLVIRENDPEISYIDQVYVIEELSNGHKRKLFPDKVLLQNSDGKYLKLARGDEVLLRFPSYRPISNASYSLFSKGYYLPFNIIQYKN